MFRMEVWKRDLEYKRIQSAGLHITISKGLIYVYYIYNYIHVSVSFSKQQSWVITLGQVMKE